MTESVDARPSTELTLAAPGQARLCGPGPGLARGKYESAKSDHHGTKVCNQTVLREIQRQDQLVKMNVAGKSARRGENLAKFSTITPTSGMD